ncbi:MAG: hypothetical protein WB973_01485 [Thermoanaerobaculia bacterium]
MKTRVFVIGFGMSAILLGICLWYVFGSPDKSAILDAFDVRNRGWYVHQPPMYNFCLLSFALMNLPAIVLSWAILSILDGMVSMSAASRAAITFGLLINFSFWWWTLITKWHGKRSRLQPRPREFREEFKPKVP